MLQWPTDRTTYWPSVHGQRQQTRYRRRPPCSAVSCHSTLVHCFAERAKISPSNAVSPPGRGWAAVRTLISRLQAADAAESVTSSQSTCYVTRSSAKSTTGRRSALLLQTQLMSFGRKYLIGTVRRRVVCKCAVVEWCCRCRWWWSYSNAVVTRRHPTMHDNNTTRNWIINESTAIKARTGWTKCKTANQIFLKILPQMYLWTRNK